jgi:transcriptional regulator with XRE-family HTH domain
MTPDEFIAFRHRMRWSLNTLARHLDMTMSRLADYETGHSRGKNPKPVTIPRVVELACRWLEEHQPPGEKVSRGRPVTVPRARRAEAAARGAHRSE